MLCLQICVCCWHWALKTPVVFHHPGAPQHMQSVKPEFCLCVHGCCCHVCFRSKLLLTVLLPGNTRIPCKHALSLKLPLQAQGLQQLCHCQNPYIDIDDGAGTTTAFADHPFQELSSNIGKFGTFGLIHTSLVRQHRFPPMIFATEQLGKAINSMASSFRAAKSTQFVYTPSNASSMRDPNFKLELIKVRSCMFAVLGLRSEV